MVQLQTTVNCYKFYNVVYIYSLVSAGSRLLFTYTRQFRRLLAVSPRVKEANFPIIA